MSYKTAPERGQMAFGFSWAFARLPHPPARDRMSSPCPQLRYPADEHAQRNTQHCEIAFHYFTFTGRPSFMVTCAYQR